VLRITSKEQSLLQLSLSIRRQFWTLWVLKQLLTILYSIGFFQEYRAEKTMDSLRQLSSPTAVVIRNGESIPIPAKDVVPGDLVAIKAGDVVAADVRSMSIVKLPFR
jgi:P-type Na+/K+ transporter